mmetsp:Transcript_1119/g.1404  ORF Transcript_1119/g.1404 Transcript_1119/m.1404 type:complete len:126 (-) Transcript_1119:218-595(-)
MCYDIHGNTMSAQESEIIKCSQCKKKFYEDGFGVDRLGKRFKTCLECKDRRKAKYEKYKCPHGKVKYACKDCGGNGICEHNKRRYRCSTCITNKIIKEDDEFVQTLFDEVEELKLINFVKNIGQD